jgi:2,3,4,5-tetrahydropyridine-2,6-dicarboxylate N-succinyltransferase
MDPRQSIIEAAFEDRANINPANAQADVKATVASILDDLDAGKLRVASRIGDSQQWELHRRRL